MITGRQFWELGQVGDEHLLQGVRALVREDRRVTARLLAHLAEVEDRRLQLKQAKSSMFEYCLELGMSEDEAWRRLCAARIAKGFPEVYRMLDERTLSLSVICGLKQYINEANHTELLEGVADMSYRKAAEWLAGRFPQPDVPSIVRKLPERSPAATRPTPGPTDASVSPTSGASKQLPIGSRVKHRARVEPLAT